MVKNPSANVGDAGDMSSIPGLGRSTVEGNGYPLQYLVRIQNTPVFLPREFHGQGSLVGYSPWGCKELDTTERLTHIHIISTQQILESCCYCHGNNVNKQE